MTDSEKLDLLLEKVSNLDEKVSILDKKVTILDKRVDNVEGDIRSVRLTLENETNRNIKIVAESHLDLSRKLNEAIKIASNIEAKQEVQEIYLNIHESKLRAL